MRIFVLFPRYTLIVILERMVVVVVVVVFCAIERFIYGTDERWPDTLSIVARLL